MCGFARRNQDCFRHLKILFAGFIALGFALATQADIPGVLTITNQPGYSIGFDGNDGLFTGVSVPENVARATHGSVAFASAPIDPFFDPSKMIDGIYGNGNCWIAGGPPIVGNAPGVFVGVRFTNILAISSIAWGRENNLPAYPDGADRWFGTYTLQVTTVANPDATTTETGDPTTGWVSIGTVGYIGQIPTFRPWMRHRYDVAQGGNPIQATGVRIALNQTYNGIDEIEVNPIPFQPLLLTSFAPYNITWDGNDAEFKSKNVPDNVASVSHGSIAFGSGQLTPDGGAQTIAKVNNGLYGVNNGWISGSYDVPGNLDFSAGPFIGVALTNTIGLSSIAWGRANTSKTNSDRCLDIYTLQITTVANPDAGLTETGDPTTGWVTIGSATYQGTNQTFNPWWRHRYDVDQAGNPIQATGVRIKVGSGNTEIDEIELNAAVGPAVLSISRQASQAVISWISKGTLQSANDVTGPWTDVTGATNPMTFSTTSNQQFYRVKY